MKRAKFFAPLAAAALLASCAGHDSAVKVEVKNNEHAASCATVELSAADILGRLGSSYCVVSDSQGREIPSQITYDSLLVFVAELDSCATEVYTITAADTAGVYPRLVSGRIYPERADDVAWENEEGGFRIYGPATQARGERAFGYDLFFKHRTPEPVLETLYGAQTSSENWAKVDSLRKIDPALAADFERSFTYHLDHGLGMDCYAVGPTAGAGVNIPVVNDSLCFAWCYSTADVLDNGPVRFTVGLTFAPRALGSDSAVVETRLISLDSRSYLNRTRVHYEGLSEPCTIALGFPRRDDSPATLDNSGVIAYADPTQGPDNGKALLGLVLPGGFDRTAEAAGHILGYTELAPADTLDYYWGFAWNRNEPQLEGEAWSETLRHLPPSVSVTVR